jgi:protein gp37
MQRTNIEWATHVCNIMTGCTHGCPYCYARAFAERLRGTKAFPQGFTPLFHERRRLEPGHFKKSAIIFADSMSDTFCDCWTDDEVLRVLHTMDPFRGAHWHKWVVLTKNPARMSRVLEKYDGPEYQRNTYFGTSVTGAGTDMPVELLAETSRLCSLKKVHDMGFKTVISFEPLLHDPAALLEVVEGVAWADWVIIGGQTGPTKIPEHHWVINVLKATRCKQPVFIKKNAGPEWASREFPEDLLPIARAWGKAP